jgi:DNA polymerase/3'-5' exonuclease PolX
MSIDYKPIILENLYVLMKNEIINNQPFKVKAYQNVIKQFEDYLGPVYSMKDVKDAKFKGIGKKIEAKLEELFKTGRLSAVRRVKEENPLELYDQLLQIYGVGPVKAKELIEEHGVTSIEDLQEKVKLDEDLLTKASKIGLDYYYDFQERIPRKEMLLHDAIVHSFLPDNVARTVGKNVPSYFQAELVGSFRRGLPDSGDIDVLLTIPKKGYFQVRKSKSDSSFSSKDLSMFYSYIKELQNVGYITDILSLGNHKCLAVCNIEDVHRRIDFVLCPYEEYYYTLLYFTGSKQFNVAMRSYALKKGWSLSQHGLERENAIGPTLKTPTSEKDIFDFLGLVYITPKDRTGPEAIIEF